MMIGWLTAGAVIAGLGTYARWIEPYWLDVSQYDVPIRDLASSFDGYRIALVSDVHWGTRRGTTWLRRIVDRVNGEAPDLVALGGDLIQHREKHVARGLRILDRLRAPDGVWCVLGNHDIPKRAIGTVPVRDELAKTGIRELRNAVVPIVRGGDRFWLGGVGDLWRDVCDVYGTFRDVPANEPRILLCHNPDGHAVRGGVRVDLMLSGHTHGGQVRLPFWGPVVTRTKSGRALAAGLRNVDGARVLVGRGVSHGSVPIRFLCRPELPMIVLRSA